MNIQPVGTKILVLPVRKEEETLDSGLILPETANADLSHGLVVSVSNQISHLFKAGDTVLYPSRKGVAQYIDNKPHLWLDAEPNKEEIWGVLLADKTQDKGNDL